MKQLRTYGRNQAICNDPWKLNQSVFEDSKSSDSDTTVCDVSEVPLSDFDRLLKDTNLNSPKNCRKSQFVKAKGNNFRRSQFLINKSSSEDSESPGSSDVFLSPKDHRVIKDSPKNEAKKPTKKNERNLRRKQRNQSFKETTVIENETLLKADNTHLGLQTPYPDFSSIEKWSLVFWEDSVTEEKKTDKIPKKKNLKRLHDPIQDKSFSPVLVDCGPITRRRSQQNVDSTKNTKDKKLTALTDAESTNMNSVFRYPTRRALKTVKQSENDKTSSNITDKNISIVSRSKKQELSKSSQSLPNINVTRTSVGRKSSRGENNESKSTYVSLQRKTSAMFPKRQALSLLNNFSPIGCSPPEKSIIIETSTPYTRVKDKSVIKKKPSFYEKLDALDSYSNLSPSLDIKNYTVLSLYKEPICPARNENSFNDDSISLSESLNETIVFKDSSAQLRLGKRQNSLEDDYSGTPSASSESSNSVESLKNGHKRMKSNDKTKLSIDEPAPFRMQTRYMKLLDQKNSVNSSSKNTRCRSGLTSKEPSSVNQYVSYKESNLSTLRMDSPNRMQISTINVVRGNIYEEIKNYESTGTSDYTSTSEKDLERSSRLQRTHLTAYKNRRIGISLEQNKTCSLNLTNKQEMNANSVQIQDSVMLSSLSCFVENIDDLENGSLLNISVSKYFSPRKSVEPGSKVFTLCNQAGPVTFMEALPRRMLNKCKKIGEGVFGEVFSTFSSERKSVAIKIIPIEGDFLVNGEKQKNFKEILPEIVISIELSSLSCGENNCTSNFIHLNRVACVCGKYPEKLLSEWDRYHKQVQSENERPNIFPETQLFVVFEFVNGGDDLEYFQFKDAMQALSVFYQTASALAVAESALEFEHRDLHWGNILISPTLHPRISCTLNGLKYSIPSYGVRVNIIDFTMSRLTKDGCTVYCDLSDDESLFTGNGDYQFEIYRLMKKYNGNNWEKFCPYTNVLWLHYVLDKLLTKKNYKNCNSENHKSAYKLLEDLHKSILSHKSSTHIILESEISQDAVCL